MKNIIRGHLILMSILMITFLWVCGRKVGTCVRTPQCFDIQADDMLTDVCKENIRHFVDGLDKRLALYPAVLVSEIKEQFPFIGTIQTRLVPPGTMKLNCKASAPLCLVNQSMVLAPPHIISSSYYCNNVLEKLPHIVIIDSLIKTYDPALLTTMVKNLDAEIFKEFNITVSAHNMLVFDDKEQPRLSLMCRIDDVARTDICEHAKNIKRLLESRHAFSSKSNRMYVADLRFEKQIILNKK